MKATARVGISGEGSGSPRKRRHVSPSMTPVPGKPAAVWNSRTASSVLRPNLPSGSRIAPLRFNNSCASMTSEPLSFRFNTRSFIARSRNRKRLHMQEDGVRFFGGSYSDQIHKPAGRPGEAFDVAGVRSRDYVTIRSEQDEGSIDNVSFLGTREKLSSALAKILVEGTHIDTG